MTEYNKPLPRVTRLSHPFWEAAKRHELMLQKCNGCGHLQYPPYATCPKCLSGSYEWTLVSGKGKVWSWVIFHQLYYPAFRDDLPYNVAVVQLEEGPKITSNIVGTANKDISCDMPVEAVFDDVTEEVSLVRFKRA